MTVQIRLDGTADARAAIARSTARPRFAPSAAGSTLVGERPAGGRRRLPERHG